jgi:hypothetical protein
MTHLPLLSLLQSPHLLPPTTDVWDPHVRGIFNLPFTRRGHLLFRCFFFDDSRADAPPPPFLLPSPSWTATTWRRRRPVEASSGCAAGGIEPRLGWWRSLWPEVGGGVELPRGWWGAPLRSASGRWGRDPLDRHARPVGRAPPRPAGASSPDGVGARLCP